MSIDHRLTLDYELQAGWLEPFVHGLKRGSAMARRCSSCNRTTFPPIRVCDCDHVHGEWIRLSGKAQIVYRTDGADGSFALVQFEGADTKTVVRLQALTDSDAFGYLQNANNQKVVNQTVTDSEHEVLKHSTGLPQLVIAGQRDGDDND